MKIRPFAIAFLTTIIAAISPSAVSEVPNAALANLEKLLAQQQWQAASDLTWKIFNPKGENTVAIEPISCTTIDSVDRLWTVYSDGRYGFSIQQQVWQEIAETRSSTREDADNSVENSADNTPEDAPENSAEDAPEDSAEDAPEDSAEDADEIWSIFYDRIGWNLPTEEAIAIGKRGYFPVSDWWLTGEILTFGCGDYYCSIPRTVIEETVPAWNIVRSRWQDCQK